MRRLIGASVGLLVAASMVVIVAFPPAAGAVDITAICAGDLVGATFTLTADCGPTSEPITVPASITTVNGDGFTISADDAGFPQFNGGVLTNAAPAQTMNIENGVNMRADLR
jgi:hypothetical protein